MKIVIVEDDKVFSDTLEDVFLLYFPKINIIGVASNVKEGIELVKNSKPDLVLLDIELPDGIGFNVIENTKEIDCKFIVLTGNINYAYESFQNKVFTFVLKFDFPDLFIKIINDFIIYIKPN